MTIRIIEDGPEIAMTRSEHNRLMAEYAEAFMFYAGTPPTFEDWVRQRGTGTVTTTIVLGSTAGEKS